MALERATPDEAPPSFQGLLEQLHARMGECLARRSRAEELLGTVQVSNLRVDGAPVFSSMASIERHTAEGQLRRYAAALISLVDASEHASSPK